MATLRREQRADTRRRHADEAALHRPGSINLLRTSTGCRVTNGKVGVREPDCGEGRERIRDILNNSPNIGNKILVGIELSTSPLAAVTGNAGRLDDAKQTECPSSG